MTSSTTTKPDIVSELYWAECQTWVDDRDNIDLARVERTCQQAQDEIADLRADLTDAGERAERAEYALREVLDRLLDVRHGLRPLDEVIAGPRTSALIEPAFPSHVTLWRDVQSWAPAGGAR